jgi:hypothetical protein
LLLSMDFLSRTKLTSETSLVVLASLSWLIYELSSSERMFFPLFLI